MHTRPQYRKSLKDKEPSAGSVGKSGKSLPAIPVQRMMEDDGWEDDVSIDMVNTQAGNAPLSTGTGLAPSPHVSGGLSSVPSHSGTPHTATLDASASTPVETPVPESTVTPDPRKHLLSQIPQRPTGVDLEQLVALPNPTDEIVRLATVPSISIEQIFHFANLDIGKLLSVRGLAIVRSWEDAMHIYHLQRPFSDIAHMISSHPTTTTIGDLMHSDPYSASTLIFLRRFDAIRSWEQAIWVAAAGGRGPLEIEEVFKAYPATTFDEIRALRERPTSMLLAFRHFRQVTDISMAVRLAESGVNLYAIHQIYTRYPDTKMTEIFALRDQDVDKLLELRALPLCESWNDALRLSMARRPAAEVGLIADLRMGASAPTIQQIVMLEDLPFAEIRGVAGKDIVASWEDVPNIIKSGRSAEAAMGHADAGKKKWNYPREIIDFGNRKELMSAGFLNPEYWENTAYSSFVLKPGVRPSVAVRDAFEGPLAVRLECLSTVRAVLAKTLLDTLGPADFDRLFDTEGYPGLFFGQDPRSQKDILFGLLHKPLRSAEDLIKGDWIYFRNHPDYSKKHPGGDWNGENCIYNGDGTYTGLGLTRVRTGELYAKMAAAFNAPGGERCPVELRKMEITEKDIPGFDYRLVRRFNFPAIRKLLESL